MDRGTADGELGARAGAVRGCGFVDAVRLDVRMGRRAVLPALVVASGVSAQERRTRPGSMGTDSTGSQHRVGVSRPVGGTAVRRCGAVGGQLSGVLV